MKVFIAVIFIIVLASYVFITGLLQFKNQALDSAGQISYGLKQAGQSLLNLEPKGAQFYFTKIQNEIVALQAQLPTFSNFIPLLKNLPPIFKDISTLTEISSNLTKKLEVLQKEGGQFVIKQNGSELVSLLEAIREDARSINLLTQKLKQQALKSNFDLGEEINAISADLYAAENFLDVFIEWLSDSHHIAIFFQNPSEIRPAGGFIGSFAHITLDKGGLTNLEVNDIYDIDGQLSLKIIPPLPLQTVTTDWGARDANWFLDYPTSAKKVISFLEASKIYQERKTKFDGAIAINVNVINDILKLIGPLRVQAGNEEEGLLISADNFLEATQREVETQQNKNILKNLTPLIFEKIGQLNDQEKKGLVEVIKSGIVKKDIMIYLDNLIMEAYLQNLGVGGEVAKLPEGFFGEYLSVVNANIAGGKSDAFTNQKIKLESKIQNSGEILNELTITRQHSGENEKDSWYTKTNQNFIQILTTPKSKLINLEGGSKKTINPQINYKKSGYKTDPDLESTQNGEQFGKTVFSSWLNVPAGETKELEITYKNPNEFDPINTQEKKYQFVFDKQSGVGGELEFSIETPPGFVWKETNSPYFTYKTEGSASRINLYLTIKKTGF